MKSIASATAGVLDTVAKAVGESPPSRMRTAACKSASPPYTRSKPRKSNAKKPTEQCFCGGLRAAPVSSRSHIMRTYQTLNMINALSNFLRENLTDCPAHPANFCPVHSVKSKPIIYYDMVGEDPLNPPTPTTSEDIENVYDAEESLDRLQKSLLKRFKSMRGGHASQPESGRIKNLPPRKVIDTSPVEDFPPEQTPSETSTVVEPPKKKKKKSRALLAVPVPRTPTPAPPAPPGVEAPESDSTSGGQLIDYGGYVGNGKYSDGHGGVFDPTEIDPSEFDSILMRKELDMPILSD